MKRWRRMIAIFLSVLLLLSMSACKQRGTKAETAVHVPSEKVQAEDELVPSQIGAEETDSEQSGSSVNAPPEKENKPSQVPAEKSDPESAQPAVSEPKEPVKEKPEKEKRPNAAVLALCTYPEATPYPYNKPSDESGIFKHQWEQERSDQWVLIRNMDGIDSFLQKTLDVCLTDTGNTLYSPINLYLAMAMLVETTEGAAQAELLALLDAPSVADLRQKATAIWKSHYRADGMVNLILACSIWLAQDLDCNAETLDRLQSNYYVSVFRGLMGSAEYDKLLQEWINNQTGNLLEKQSSQIRMTADTLLSLVSTIYYTVPWEQKFKSAGTAPFYNGTDGATGEYMQNQNEGLFYWGEHFSAVDCTFGAQGGKMRFILPDQGIDAHALLQESELQSFIMSNEWENTKKVDIYRKIPKFDISQSQELIPALKELGVKKIFSASDSFSPLLGDCSASVSTIKHAARVMIDEEGCKAAAYTEVVYKWSGSPDLKEDFIVDRPFIFVVYSNYDVPLFVGVVDQV